MRSFLAALVRAGIVAGYSAAVVSNNLQLAMTVRF